MNNIERFNKIRRDYGLTQADCAAYICEYTRRPLSVRTIRSWLNDQSKPSSRPCPDWAVEALENAVSKKEITQ